ncbi:transposable element Tc3 transposase [Trichonephila clavipes]|nr:transposable element Tc3 transposase [Trichonephila clavipes]
MSERGETDSHSIGSSDKFRATAVRRNVVHHQTSVSRILYVDQSVIPRLWQRFQRTGDVTRQPVLGRPRVTTPRQDRYLVISARRQRGSTARGLGSAFSRHRNTNFETNCLQETQSCWPVCQKTISLHSPHVCA